MGRRLRTRSNPDLVEAHAIGSKVRIMQALVHDRYGSIAYEEQRLWCVHYKIFEAAVKALERCDALILEIEPSLAQFRIVRDQVLLNRVYAAGTTAVSNAVRAVQHLAQEIERVSEVPLTGKTVEER